MISLPSPVLDTYWRHTAERQEMFFRRYAGQAAPWTADPILGAHRFTNAYRAADRVSQYLIRNVIYAPGTWSVEDTVFRILLFKVFNRIETWEALEALFGRIDVATFDFVRARFQLTALRAEGPIFTAAYVMAMPRCGFGSDKAANWLALLHRMLMESLPARVAEAKSLAGVYKLLNAYPGIGPFLAYQYAIDINYSTVTNFDEDSFVMPGPGALSGIKKCFPAALVNDRDVANASLIIMMLVETQEAHFARLGVTFKDLFGRRLHAIDCQNGACEVDKDARERHPAAVGIGGRTNIKQTFTVSARPLPPLFFPPKWGINDRIAPTLRRNRLLVGL